MEEERGANRRVAVCLLGVAHDLVEDRLEARLKYVSVPNEVVFWESGRRRMDHASGTNGHWGLEDRFLRTTTSLFTMLVVFVTRFPEQPDDDVRRLGHGDIFGAYGFMAQQPDWLALPLWQRAIYILFNSFFGALCHASAHADQRQSVDASISEFFNNEERVIVQLWNLLTACHKRLVWKECHFLLDGDTMPALFDFLASFEALLIENRDVLAPPLQEAAQLLLGMSEITEAEPVYRRLQAAGAAMRDESNWAYARSFAELHGEIERIVLVVGQGHFARLQSIIARHNAALKPAREEDILFEVTEIDYEVDDSYRFIGDPVVVVDTVLERIRQWRQLNEQH